MMGLLYMKNIKSSILYHGYCLINKNKIAIINKYFTIEGKINSLVEIINQIEIDYKNCDANQIKILKKIIKNWKLNF